MNRRISFQNVLPVLVTTLSICFVGDAKAQFTSSNVSQHAWLDLTDLTASAGCDSWGYVSGSGREYALMGVNTKLVVVEITDPANPVIVGSIAHTTSDWCDVKTFGDHAYVTNESGGGFDIIDLSDVDNGNVTLVTSFTAGGVSSGHNVLVNTDTGFLYLLGSNLNGGAVIAFDLNVDPENPTELGRWTEASAAYHHDAHIVSYTSGIYAGREILFGFSEGRGVDIVDVTDKSNMFMLSRTSYPNIAYCHQGWTTPDRKYLYVDDELDEGTPGVPTTRTLIFNIEDLSNPNLVGTFTTGEQSRDHNLYIDGCVMFQTNYSTGLRVINIANPEAPVEVGFYDTYPENNAVNFNGAWSNYPFFPSGTVIVSDIDRGLFVLDVSAALAQSALLGVLEFAYTPTLPQEVSALSTPMITVDLAGICGGLHKPNTGQLHYDLGTGFVSVPMNSNGLDQYQATLPPALCGQQISYYFSAETEAGLVITDPSDAPATVYSAIVSDSTIVVFDDNFDNDLSWTVGPDSASTGTFVRGDPVGTGAQPENDNTPVGTGRCMYTATNPAGGIGTDDVDNGTVVLTSPTFDLSAGDARVSYYRWYFERDDGDDPADGFVAEISNNNGGSWTTIESLSPGSGGWELVEFMVSDFVAPTGQVQLRFMATDGAADGDIVEAAIDDVLITRATCNPQSPDMTADGSVDLEDFALLQQCYTGAGSCICYPPLYGPLESNVCAAADLDIDGDIDETDYANFAGALLGP
ncbi:MAG: choice-of-anchor B family protein [Planctomycetes bacterium]|nr:choice-of-anchor B family protein [Planctomycetota bacterium]